MQKKKRLKLWNGGKQQTNSRANKLIGMDNTELNKGRIAVWLDPNDIKFIANEWRKIPENINDSHKETWGRIVFRFMTALNKAGIEYKPEYPIDMKKYFLKE